MATGTSAGGTKVYALTERSDIINNLHACETPTQADEWSNQTKRNSAVRTQQLPDHTQVSQKRDKTKS